MFLKKYFTEDKLKNIFNREKDFFENIVGKANKIKARTIRKKL